MPNFFVRLRSNREAVGLFAVEDFDELLCLVDEVTDPASCEFAEIGSGSVIWEFRATPVPNPTHDWENETRALLDVIGPHDVGGNWGVALFDETLVFHPCCDGFEMSSANDP